MKFGDIYLVNFDPSFGKEYKKLRPALVVQMEKVNEYSPYVSVVPISSRLDRGTLHDVFIPKDKKNRLMKDSVAKVYQVASFDKRRFVKFIGEANSPVLRKVRGYLRKHFGF